MCKYFMHAWPAPCLFVCFISKTFNCLYFNITGIASCMPTLQNFSLVLLQYGRNVEKFFTPAFCKGWFPEIPQNPVTVHGLLK